MEDYGNLTRKQEAAIGALLTNPTIDAAASAVGVSASTLYRWQKDEAFQAALRLARTRLLDNATLFLRHAASRAAATLVRNLNCGNPSVETRAAGLILEMAYRSAEIEDMQGRIDALEAALLLEPGEGEGGKYR